MKHIFILNPAAGKGNAEKTFLPQIIETAKRMEIDYEIHRTMAPGDAQRYIKYKCGETPGAGCENVIRFYACGGDGTLNEVVNGAYGYANTEIAMIPAGTGNDFTRVFRNSHYFTEIERQILGSAKAIDLIQYQNFEGRDDLGPDICYGINMFNIGLDCNVVDEVARIKKYPLIAGPLAYMIGVGIVLGKKRGVNLEIIIDEEKIHRGSIMLTAIGNGSFCGGGFNGLPKARIDDGYLDISIIKNVSRRTFLSLIGKYRKGTYLEDPAATEIVKYIKCKRLTIIPDGRVKMCVDGEISMVGRTTFGIVPGGIKFSVPQGCE